ncbi:MAG: hypothetical protein SFZ03_02835 [Candidatus Melainabacteria bacterium]|nr:hypothetical protein [Candidatus Melainabacteria bacterium]
MNHLSASYVQAQAYGATARFGSRLTPADATAASNPEFHVAIGDVKTAIDNDNPVLAAKLFSAFTQGHFAPGQSSSSEMPRQILSLIPAQGDLAARQAFANFLMALGQQVDSSRYAGISSQVANAGTVIWQDLSSSPGSWNNLPRTT